MPVAAQLQRIRERMAAACARAHRPETAVRLVAVTKTVAPERILECHAAGVRIFGENRVQERMAKAPALAAISAQWRLIGPLQSNKAARALERFDAVDSVDSPALGRRLSRLAAAAGRRLPVLMEVNLGREPQKRGVLPEAAAELAQELGACEGIELRGLMTVPPAAETAEASRRYFAGLAALAARLHPAGAAPWELSMGMSHDFEVAIEEGATLVRIGSALFGERL